VGVETPVPVTEVFTIRIEGRQELRYLDFRDMGRTESLPFGMRMALSDARPYLYVPIIMESVN
jgi:hypothetical protein